VLLFANFNISQGSVAMHFGVVVYLIMV